MGRLCRKANKPRSLRGSGRDITYTSGDNVVVIGGGSVGVETAAASALHEITLLVTICDLSNQDNHRNVGTNVGINVGTNGSEKLLIKPERG